MSCDVESNPNQTHVITSQQHLTDWLDRLVSEMATGLVVRRGCLLPRPRPALLPARACSAARSASPREDLAVEQLARARAGVGEVELPQPHMENLWTGDTFLQSYLTRVLPPDLRRQLEPDLARSAAHCSSQLYTQLYTAQVGRAVRPGGGAAGPAVRGGSAQTGDQQCLGR